MAGTCPHSCKCAVPCGMWNTHWRWPHLIYTKRHKWMRDVKFEKKITGLKFKKNWRSKSINSKISRDLNSAKMHLWSKFGNHDFNQWGLIARTNSKSKWGKCWLWSEIRPWMSRSITLQNNWDLNCGLLHLRSKFCDSSLNGWWVIARTNLVKDGRTDWWTDGRTDASNDNTRRPKLASGIKQYDHLTSKLPVARPHKA